MNRNKVIIFIAALSVIALTLLAVQIKNMKLKQNKLLEPEVKKVKHVGAGLPSTSSGQVAPARSNVGPLTLSGSVNLPSELREELLEAAARGNIDTQWGENKITQKEIDDAGLSLRRLARQRADSKTENITAGYRVNMARWQNILAACKPDKGDNEQLKELKSQALAELGVSALAEGNKEQIQEIINQTEVLEPMLALESALLSFEDGNKDEALRIIDRAILENQGDKEFIEIARLLQENINRYE